MRPDVVLRLTTEQIDQIQDLIERAQKQGGMILGSVDGTDHEFLKLAVIERQTAILIIGIADCTRS